MVKETDYSEEERLFNTLSKVPHLIIRDNKALLLSSGMEYEDMVQELNIACLRAVRFYMTTDEEQKAVPGALFHLACIASTNKMREIVRTKQYKKRRYEIAVQNNAELAEEIDNPLYNLVAAKNTEEGMELHALISATRQSLRDSPKLLYLFDSLRAERRLVDIAKDFGICPQSLQYQIRKLRSRLEGFKDALMEVDA